MEQDKQLKHILANGAKGASSGFTEAVMKRVHGLSATPFYYQPLVKFTFQRIFLLTFGALIVAILFLCLLITLNHVQVVSWIQNLDLPDLKYNKILVFMLIFWIVFSGNVLLEKKFLFRRGPSF